MRLAVETLERRIGTHIIGIQVTLPIHRSTWKRPTQKESVSNGGGGQPHTSRSRSNRTRRSVLLGVRSRERKKAAKTYYMVGIPSLSWVVRVDLWLFLLPPSCHGRCCDCGVVPRQYHGWKMRQQGYTNLLHKWCLWVQVAEGMMVRGKELHTKNVEHQSTKSRVAEFEWTWIKFASHFLVGRNLWRTEQ